MRIFTFLAFIALALACSACKQSPEVRKKQAFDKGKQHLVAKDYTRAILEFKNAAQADGRDAETFYQLGLAYAGAGDIRSAAGAFHRATELNPTHTDAQVRLAEIQAGTGQPSMVKDAIQRMETSLASSPNNADVLRTLAFAEFALGESDDAEKHLVQAVENAPASVKSAAALAQLRMSQNKSGEAEQILKKAADQKPPAAMPVILLGGFYVDSNRLAEARSQFLRALEIEKDNPVALLYLGRLQLKAGETDEASKTFKRVSSLPDKQFRFVYSAFLFRSGKRNEAIQELEAMARASGEDRAVRRALLSAYMASGRTADAERMLTDVLKKNSKDSDALLARSAMLLSSGKHMDAYNDLNQIIRLEPNSAAAHYLLARVHAIQGNEKSRRQELSEAVRLNPELLAARLELSGSMLASNAKSAADVMKTTPEWQRRNPAVAAQRNWALLASGDKDEAAKGIIEGLALARTSDLLLQDAIVKLDRRDFASARASLEEVLQKYPEETRALDLLTHAAAMQKQLSAAGEKVRAHAKVHLKSAVVQHYLGTWLQRNGAPEEARSAFAAAKAADSKFWMADLSLASVDAAQNKIDSVRTTLQPLLADRQAGLRARLILAWAEDTRGDRAVALEHYRKIVEQQPDNVFALNNLAYVLADHANAPDEALKIAQKAKELAPDNPTVDDTLGWVYYKKGLYSNAVPYLESSVKRQPNAARHAHLATAYAKRGDKTRAVEHLEAAMKLDARNRDVLDAQKLVFASR